MKRLKHLSLLLIGLLIVSCDNDDSLNPVTDPILDNITYDLGELNDSGVSGDATFNEQEDGSIQLIVEVEGTSAGNTHPAHIHMNSAAESGDIIVSLEPVQGDTGLSITTFSAFDDGTPISFEDVEGLDAYINVHLSADDLATVVAQGDIGENELTGESKSYELGEADAPGISGSVLFEERESGEALATIMLEGTPDDGEHPAHIHMNTAAEGGDIIYSFNPVNGATGMSKTHVATLDDDTAFLYEDVLEVDGYVNVHLSADELGTIVAQGDIGQNELTGEEKSYELGEVDAPGISGSVLFEERVNGEALATIMLEGTPDDGEHPAHIHMNTAAEGGDIIYTFNPVNGATGMSQSNVAALDDETAFGYDDVLDVDGYVNVHFSADELGTIVAQGDIGQNEFTGESKSYDLGERAVPGISGSILFEERANGFALATINLENTPADGEHPAHIHMNTAAEGGDIIFTFTSVEGSTGMSVTETDDSAMDGENTFTYSDILEIDGYVNVHLSADELGTIVAQGDIGQNELTGESMTYTLNEVDVPGINGDVTFEERVNGEALATLSLENTIDGEEHPAHIHMNSAAETGDIIYTFTPVDGTSGMSLSNVAMLDDDTAFGYDDVLEVDGYVNVHLSADELGTIVAQSDIGSNF